MTDMPMWAKRKLKQQQTGYPSPSLPTRNSMPPVQRKRISSDRFEELCKKFLREISDEEFEVAYQNLDDNILLQKLIDYRYLAKGLYDIVEPDDKKKDPTFGSSKRQYLNPNVLRTNLGANGAGGEAHHIIPGCVAQEKGYSPNECDEAWNGIILPDTNGGKHQAVKPSVKHGAAFHRKDNQRDHPDYTNVVRNRLMGVRNIDGARYIASRLCTEIQQMKKGEWIDSIT